MSDYRWVFSARGIPDIDAERARLRFTLNYRVLRNLQLGVEWNPLGDKDKVGPLANWTVWDETRNRPALILGTSSDRIGTDEGQAWFATFSKNVDPWIGVAVSPYLGASWNDRDQEWLFIGGANYRLGERYVVRHLWDGKNLHHTLDYTRGRHTVGLVLAEDFSDYSLGLTFGTRF